MTWKERRNVTILLAIAGALFFALLIVFGMIYRQGREEALAEKGNVLSENGVSIDPKAYNHLSYYNGSVTLTFALNEKGNWIWSDGPDFPLEDSTVTSVLETLSSLKFQQTLPATETKEEYGLDAPSAILTASSAKDTQTLSFGKTTTDGNSYYMMMNGDETTVYIVADALVKQMQTPIYEMCTLPELPDLSELNLRAITILGPAPAVEPSENAEAGEPEEPERPAVSLNARRSKNDQPALWYSGNDNVTAAALVQDLLHDLDAMTLVKCVDYYPSDEAAEICGFDNPDAILKVEYDAGNGDETFILNIGAQMPDGSGRYVRLGDNGAIYAMSPDYLDAVMPISANGLRGADGTQTGGEE